MELAKKTLTVCLVVAGFVALLYFLFLSRVVILYFVVAVLFVIAIGPLVRRLERGHIKKTWAIIFSDLLLVIVLGGILGTIVTPLVIQGISFVQNLPTITAHLLSNPTIGGYIQKYHIAESIQQLANNPSTVLLGTGATALSVVGGVVSKFTTGGILFVLTVLLQFEGSGIWHGIVKLLKPKDAVTTKRIGEKIAKAISGFVSGNLFISLIAGVVTFITLLILHVPYKLALSALVALFDLIPLIGAAIATIVVGLVALTQGIVVAIIVAGVLIVYQFVEGHVIQPLVYSRSIDLSALLVVIASILGARIGGVVGILLAIPAAAILQILSTEIYTTFRSRA